MNSRRAITEMVGGELQFHPVSRELKRARHDARVVSVPQYPEEEQEDDGARRRQSVAGGGKGANL